MYGLFTVNLGVYIPEVARVQGGGEAKSWVQDYHCAIRQRLGPLSGERKDVWWYARQDAAIVEDVRSSLVAVGLPFLERFSTRDQILLELGGLTENAPHCAVPRIVRAIILASRNELGLARDLLASQAQEACNPHHSEHVRKLAARLGLGVI